MALVLQIWIWTEPITLGDVMHLNRKFRMRLNDGAKGCESSVVVVVDVVVVEMVACSSFWVWEMLLVGGCSSDVDSAGPSVAESMMIGAGASGSGMLIAWSRLILLMNSSRMLSGLKLSISKSVAVMHEGRIA